MYCVLNAQCCGCQGWALSILITWNIKFIERLYEYLSMIIWIEAVTISIPEKFKEKKKLVIILHKMSRDTAYCCLWYFWNARHNVTGIFHDLTFYVRVYFLCQKCKRRISNIRFTSIYSQCLDVCRVSNAEIDCQRQVEISKTKQKYPLLDIRGIDLVKKSFSIDHRIRTITCSFLCWRKIITQYFGIFSGFTPKLSCISSYLVMPIVVNGKKSMMVQKEKSEEQRLLNKKKLKRVFQMNIYLFVLSVG